MENAFVIHPSFYPFFVGIRRNLVVCGTCVSVFKPSDSRPERLSKERSMLDARMQGLIQAIVQGDSKEAVRHAQNLKTCGITAQEIVVSGVEAAMSTLDEKCTLEQFNLLEIMLAGRAVTEVMKFLYPGDSAPAGPVKGTVVLATLEGDVHDLGKNIVKTILTASSYRVVDCGKDCSLRRLIAATEKEAPLAVGISGLITPVIPLVRQVKDLLVVHGLDGVRVFAGGAALKQSSPQGLNVDFVAESAFDGLHYVNQLAGHSAAGGP